MIKKKNYGRKCYDRTTQKLFIYKFAFRLLFPCGERLKIVMEGLEIMNDDPKDVNVLYAKVHLDPPKYNASFQRFVNGLSDAFAKRGFFSFNHRFYNKLIDIKILAFVNQQYDNVKLHVTVMNSIFRNSEADESEKVKRKSFDASLILEKYKNFKFGIADLKALHLSIRFQFGDDKYYKPECVLDL